MWGQQFVGKNHQKPVPGHLLRALGVHWPAHGAGLQPPGVAPEEAQPKSQVGSAGWDFGKASDRAVTEKKTCGAKIGYMMLYDVMWCYVMLSAVLFASIEIIVSIVFILGSLRLRQVHLTKLPQRAAPQRRETMETGHKSWRPQLPVERCAVGSLETEQRTQKLGLNFWPVFGVSLCFSCLLVLGIRYSSSLNHFHLRDVLHAPAPELLDCDEAIALVLALDAADPVPVRDFRAEARSRARARQQEQDDMQLEPKWKCSGSAGKK